MATVISVTPSGGSAVNFTDGYTYATDGKYLKDSPQYDAKRYEFEEASSSGVDGVGIKNFGRRGQLIRWKATYVAATETALMTAFEADNLAINATLSTLVYGGATHTRCQCVKMSVVGRGARPGGGTKVYFDVEFEFDCKA
jgi:hypothetical protein